MGFLTGASGQPSPVVKQVPPLISSVGKNEAPRRFTKLSIANEELRGDEVWVVQTAECWSIENRRCSSTTVMSPKWLPREWPQHQTVIRVLKISASSNLTQYFGWLISGNLIITVGFACSRQDGTAQRGQQVQEERHPGNTTPNDRNPLFESKPVIRADGLVQSHPIPDSSGGRLPWGCHLKRGNRWWTGSSVWHVVRRKETTTMISTTSRLYRPVENNNKAAQRTVLIVSLLL